MEHNTPCGFIVCAVLHCVVAYILGTVVGDNGLPSVR